MTRHTITFPRSFIGFDSLASELLRFPLESETKNYPPQNIIKINEDEFVIELAVAGLTENDIELVQDNNLLTIRYDNKDDKYDAISNRTSSPNDRTYIHRGISNRSFKHSYRLGEHVDITDVFLTNGILNVFFKRTIPEELKPKKIPIRKEGKENGEKELLTESN